MEIKQKKEKKPRTRDAKFKLATRIIAIIMIALMLFAALSSGIYGLVQYLSNR